MEINRDKIAYLPGLLAHKLGIGKGTLMKHLRATGLIEQCWRTKYSWRIPYEVALQIASPEILAGPPPGRRKRSARLPQVRGESPATTFSGAKKNERQPEPDKPAREILPDYRQIGKTLRVAGVTMSGLIKYIQQQMGGNNEQTQIPLPPFGKGENNSAKRDENQTATKSTNGGENSDISNTGS